MVGVVPSGAISATADGMFALARKTSAHRAMNRSNADRWLAVGAASAPVVHRLSRSATSSTTSVSFCRPIDIRGAIRCPVMLEFGLRPGFVPPLGHRHDDPQQLVEVQPGRDEALQRRDRGIVVRTIRTVVDSVIDRLGEMAGGGVLVRSDEQVSRRLAGCSAYRTHTSPRIGESCSWRRLSPLPSRMYSMSARGISMAIIHPCRPVRRLTRHVQIQR